MFSFLDTFALTMYLDLCISTWIRKAKYLEKSKHLIVWYGGSTWLAKQKYNSYMYMDFHMHVFAKWKGDIAVEAALFYST